MLIGLIKVNHFLSIAIKVIFILLIKKIQNGLQNNQTKGVFNGDIGVIISISIEVNQANESLEIMKGFFRIVCFI